MNKKLIAALFAGAFAFVSASAIADDKTPPVPVDQAKLKAERDAARTQWNAMTPEQKAATRKAMQSKKVSDLSMLEMYAQDNGDDRVSQAETAQMKADRSAAKMKWDSMTPEQKAAMRKAAQQKKLSELSMLEMISVHGQ